MIETFIGEEALRMAKRAAPGLYIVRSKSEPTYYRIGQTANLSNRLGNHGRESGLVSYSDPDFSQMYQPWYPVWIALASESENARLVCENILTGEAGRLFQMVAGSSFIIPPDRHDDLISLAQGLRITFEEVESFQSIPTFQKKKHRAERLAARGLTVGP